MSSPRTPIPRVVSTDLDWPRLLRLADALGVQVWRAWGEGPLPASLLHLPAYAGTPHADFPTTREAPERSGARWSAGRPSPSTRRVVVM
jgi:hypothetical protein